MNKSINFTNRISRNTSNFWLNLSLFPPANALVSGWLSHYFSQRYSLANLQMVQNSIARTIKEILWCLIVPIPYRNQHTGSQLNKEFRLKSVTVSTCISWHIRLCSLLIPQSSKCTWSLNTRRVFGWLSWSLVWSIGICHPVMSPLSVPWCHSGLTLKIHLLQLTHSLPQPHQ